MYLRLLHASVACVAAGLISISAQSQALTETTGGHGVMATAVAMPRLVQAVPLVSCPIDLTANVMDLNCAGDNTGAVFLTSTNWTLPLTNIDWSDDTYDGLLTVMGIPAGPYMVTVVDGNNCSVSVSFVVQEPPPLELRDCLADFNDNSSSFGFIEFYGTGGTGNYNIYIEGPTMITDLDDPVAPNSPGTTYFIPETNCILVGDYTIRIEDENGCETTCGPIPFDPECRLSASAVVNQPACETPGGNISLSVAGDYCNTATYSWTGGLSGPNPTNIPDGTYSVTVADVYDCQQILGPFVISTPQPATIVCNPATTTGPNVADGSIAVEVIGGTGPFTLNWSGETTGMTTGVGPTITATGLPPGDYDLTLTDSLGCVTSCQATVALPPCNLQFACTGIDPQLVDSNGQVGIEILSGSSPFTVEYQGPMNGTLSGQTDSSITIADLPPGAYSLTVTDELGCIDSCVVTIVAVDCSTFSLTSGSMQPTCGSLNGEISLMPQGGETPYQYDWMADSLDGQQHPIGLGNGTYSVTVSDARNCDLPALEFILAGPAVLELVCLPTDVSANNLSDGSIELSLSGGTPPYYLSWSSDTESGLENGISDGFVLSGLPAGDYTLMVTDAAGCTIECTTTVEEPPCLLLLTGSATDPICAGDSSGLIELMITGVTGDLTIDWTDDEYDGMATPAGLPAGTYTVRVTDESACGPEPISFVLLDPPVFTVTATATDNLCAGDSLGSINLDLSGGAGPFDFSWNVTALNGQSNPINLPAGLYEVSVTDQLGCLAVDTALVAEPLPLSMSCEPTDETDNGSLDGTIALTFAGGTAPFQISGDLSAAGLMLNDSPYTFGNLGPGNYQLVLTDANGCALSCVAFVGPGGCAIDLDFAIEQPDCDAPNGAVIVTINAADAPFTFDWADDQYDGESALMDLPPATYVLTVTDERFCRVDSQFTIIPFEAFPGFSLGQPALSCYDDCQEFVLDLGGTGPFSLGYNYEHPVAGTGSETVLLQGDETVLTICPADLGVASLLGLSLEFTRLEDAICDIDTSLFRLAQVGNLATDTLSGSVCAESVLMVGNTIFDRDNPSGEVWLTDATQLQCDSLVVVDLDFFAPALGSVERTLCETEFVMVGDQRFDTNRPAGEVVLSGAAAMGCDSTVAVELSFFPPAVSQLDSTLCPGGSLLVAGELFDAARPSGQVLLSGASANGCDSTVNVNLSFYPSVTVSLSGDGELCFDEPLVINLDNSASIPLSVELSGTADGPLMVPPGMSEFALSAGPGSEVGIFQVEQGGLPCPVEFSGNVAVERSSPSVSLQSLNAAGGFDLTCFDSADGHVSAEVSGGRDPYSYQWSTGSAMTELTGLGPGPVLLTVTDDFGCVATIDRELLAPPALSMAVNAAQASCVNGLGEASITDLSGGVGPYLYRIDGGAFLPVRTLPAPLVQPAGQYLLEVEDANGCRLATDFTISPAREPQLLILPEDEQIRLGDSLLLTAFTDVAVDSLLWSSGETTFPFTQDLEIWVQPHQTSEYQLWMRDGGGCQVRARVQVLVDRRVPIFLPTAFSPNGDGLNDDFRAFTGAGVQALRDFRIFDRWGNIVHLAEGELDLNNPESWSWDGRLDGRPLNSAIFVFQISLTYIDGREDMVTGEVLLLR